VVQSVDRQTGVDRVTGTREGLGSGELGAVLTIEQTHEWTRFLKKDRVFHVVESFFAGVSSKV
jgi:hypothetical protein